MLLLIYLNLSILSSQRLRMSASNCKV